MRSRGATNGRAKIGGADAADRGERPMAKNNGTVVYQRQHKRGLTLPQLNAVDLLASGKTDKETAELLNLSRTCVTKWRLYDPSFQAALNVRRAEVWGAGVDRLRSLVPLALDALGDVLQDRDSPDRLKAAVEVLKLARLPSVSTGADGPTDPEEIVRLIVEARRERAPRRLDDVLEGNSKGLPPLAEHVAQVWRELEALASEADAPDEAKGAAGDNAP
jgi:hypothetical protein